MSKLSRRSFLKGTAVSALGAAALGMTACSNNTAASSTASSAAASAPASSTPAQQPAAAETGKPGFFTLRGVLALFSNPKAVLAAWIHILAFDLMVGLHIQQQGAA